MKNSAGKTFTAGSTVKGNIYNYGGGDVLQDESWYTSLGGGLGGSAINEFSIADGSWTRLREVSLGYSITGPKFKKQPNSVLLIFRSQVVTWYCGQTSWV
ncbi:MAG: hypothetical protein IPO69_03165 [Saprospiraceae bacterium]|nr:hypothetical protein [Saprospiraceae bacterium]